jgi:hypothetical protein
MFGMRGGGRAILLAAESATVLLLSRRIAGDGAIPEPFVGLPLRVPRPLGHRTRRYVLANVALVPVAQILIRIRNAPAMLSIVRPHTGAVRSG